MGRCGNCIRLGDQTTAANKECLNVNTRIGSDNSYWVTATASRCHADYTSIQKAAGFHRNMNMTVDGVASRLLGWSPGAE
jgi:hypothetical protein